jgi:glycosyltransferase involved in cell wall biosynthesis
MGYWNTPWLLRLLKFVNRRADYFLVNAEVIRRHVAAVEGFPLQRIKVIPNGLWDRSAPSPSPGLRSTLGLAPGSRVVGLIANLRPVKRIDRFLAVARAVSLRRPDTFFLILGDGPLHATLSAELRADPIASKFLLLGRVPDVSAYLPLFDVAVLTSESEGLSNALIEYASAGIPAVAFDVGGNSEVVVDGTTGFLVRNGDVPSMADSVHTLLTDSELRARMSRAAREFAMCRFSASTVQRELEDFLEAASTTPRRSLTFA